MFRLTACITGNETENPMQGSGGESPTLETKPIRAPRGSTGARPLTVAVEKFDLSEANDDPRARPTSVLVETKATESPSKPLPAVVAITGAC